MTFEELEFFIMSSTVHRAIGDGASEQDIAHAEKTLGVEIRGKYRQFLRRFGWVEFLSLETYGLGNDVPPHLNLINIALSERSEMVPRLPIPLIPLMNDGGGNLFCLDTRACQDSECPVALWVHDRGENQIPTPVEGDFVTWFFGKLAEAMHDS